MRKDLEKRLDRLEASGKEWSRRLRTLDYDVLGIDYANDDEWEEIYFEQPFAVYRHVETGELRGSYEDRRTHEEILNEVASLEYL